MKTVQIHVKPYKEEALGEPVLMLRWAKLHEVVLWPEVVEIQCCSLPSSKVPNDRAAEW